MKTTKREWMPLYSYLDRTAITAHLSDMAAQGWMLEKLGAWGWRPDGAEKTAVCRHLLPRRFPV